MRRIPALLFLSLLIPTTAAAGDLRYEAPESCPTRVEVQKRLDERAPKAGAVDLTIRSAGADGGFIGNEVVGADADAVHRQFESQTCEGVVEAALLVAALARPAPDAPKVSSPPAVGAAPVSTSHVDVTLAACGTANVGDMSRLWADAGGLARAQVQIGRKAALRGFVDVSFGIVAKLVSNQSAIEQTQTITNPAPAYGIRYPEPGTMWTFGLGGGVLLP